MAFEVETGTGSATATSYTSVAFGDSHVADFMSGAYETAWTGASESGKQDALMIASLSLESRYGSRLLGRRKTETQARLWPRSNVCDRDDYKVPDDAVPTPWQQATVELAARHLAGETIIADVAAGSGGLTELQGGVTPGPFVRQKWAGSRSDQLSVPIVDGLVAQYLTAIGSRELG